MAEQSAESRRPPRAIRVVTAASHQRRISRASEPPSPWSETAGRPAKLIDLGVGYPVSVARTGWRYVGDEPVIKQRATELRVHDRGQMVAHVQAWEFRAEPFALERFDFFSLMDAESDEAQRLAEVVLSCWLSPFEDLTDYGELLLIDFAWSPPDARHPIWALTLEAALSRLFTTSVGMFAQAFPTQYAGNLPGPCPARIGFRRR